MPQDELLNGRVIEFEIRQGVPAFSPIGACSSYARWLDVSSIFLPLCWGNGEGDLVSSVYSAGVSVLTERRGAQPASTGFSASRSSTRYSPIRSIPLVLRLGTDPTRMVFTTSMVLLSTTTVASLPATAT